MGFCGSSFMFQWASAGMGFILIAVCYSAWLLPIRNLLYLISSLEEDSMSQQSLLSSSQSAGCTLHFSPAQIPFDVNEKNSRPYLDASFIFLTSTTFSPLVFSSYSPPGDSSQPGFFYRSPDLSLSERFNPYFLNPGPIFANQWKAALLHQACILAMEERFFLHSIPSRHLRIRFYIYIQIFETIYQTILEIKVRLVIRLKKGEERSA